MPLENMGEKEWAIAAPIGLSVLGGLARLAMLQRKLTPGDVARGVIIAAFSGWLVNAGLAELGVGEGLRAALTGAAAFLGDLLLSGLLDLGRRFAADPLATWDAVLTRLRPGRVAPAAPEPPKDSAA